MGCRAFIGCGRVETESVLELIERRMLTIMIKTVRGGKRRQDLSLEQFKAYFLDNHSKLERIVVQLAPTKKIIPSFATGEMVVGWPRTKLVSEKETPFDALVGLYYDSAEDMRISFAGLTPAIMRKDEENFADMSEERVRTATEEYVTAERTPEKLRGIPLPIKAVRFVKRRRDLTREQFKAYWLDKHARFEKMVVEKTPARKIVVSFATGEMVGGKEPPFDAMVEVYFDSTKDLRAAFAQEIPAILHKDEENFVDLTGEVVHVVAEEYITAEKS